uniref:Uncharacterized protein n=2 Tax=Ochrobactrum sp. LM19 TaxID=1449781 RepID=A0A0D5A0W9_9HYPH|nr:hypothetical protein pLM19O2_p15 [Ochrobactrum sp. LM19]
MTVTTTRRRALVETLSDRLGQEPKTIAEFLIALKDEGMCIVRTEELAAILADLNQLIVGHVPLKTALSSPAYERSQQLVNLLDERLKHY